MLSCSKGAVFPTQIVVTENLDARSSNSDGSRKCVAARYIHVAISHELLPAEAIRQSNNKGDKQK
jgi:hypothetical protein